MGYRLSRAAEEDVIALYGEGVLQFGQAQADRYLVGLERAFRFLADYPYAARVRVEIDPPVRCLAYGVHMVIYLADASERALILRIRHSREDWLNDPL